MKPAQLRIFQALSDLAIPLLGFFLWNWDFYFILLFLLLDYFVFCVFSFVKERKIDSHQGIPHRFNLQNFLLTVLLVAASLAILFPAISIINPAFDIAKDTWAFLAYKDMGIAQGTVLLPLLIFGGYVQYKMQFLVPRKFATLSKTEVWKMHFMTILLVLSASGLLLGTAFLIVFPSIVYILALIFGVAAYRFFYSR